MQRALIRVALSIFALVLVAGCPHRSPVWSPDGARIVVLAGKSGEEVDKAASQLWLADVASGKARSLQCPDAGVRYLAAEWLDAQTIAVLTGKWDSGFIAEGSEKSGASPRAEGDGAEWQDLSSPAERGAPRAARPSRYAKARRARSSIRPETKPSS